LLVELDISFNSFASLDAFNGTTINTHILDLYLNTLFSIGLKYCRKLRHIQIQDNPLVLIPNENILHNNIDINLTQYSMSAVECHIVSLCPSLSTFCRNKVSMAKGFKFTPGKHDATLLLPYIIVLSHCVYSEIPSDLSSLQSFIHYGKAIDTKTYDNICSQEIRHFRPPSEGDQLIQLLLSIDAEQNNVAMISKSKQDSVSLLEMLKSHLLLLENYGAPSNDGNTGTVIINYNESNALNKCEVPPSTLEMKECLSRVPDITRQNEYSNHTSNHTYSATKIQSVMRGWRSRKNLRNALESAHYHDDELDELLNMDLNFQFDTEDIMSEINGFYVANKNNDRNLEKSEYNSSPESKLASSDTLMVYGDHRRRRAPNSNNFLLQPSSADYCNEVTEELGSPRPSTAMTDASDLTVSTSAHTEKDYEEYSVRSRTESHQQSSESIKEWGISDPKVIAMMLKRNKRLKSFEQAIETRERERGKKSAGHN